MFTGAKEKDSFLVYDNERKQCLEAHKYNNVRYFVSVDIYINKENSFLKYLSGTKYVKREADTVFPNKYPTDAKKRGYFEKYVYEVLNHNTTTGIQTTNYNFILSTYRPNLLDNYRYFDFQNEKYYWENSTWSDQLKNKIFTEGRRIVLYRTNTIKLKPDDFVSYAEKEILKLMTPLYSRALDEVRNNHSIQISFFLYDRSDIIMKTFVTEINNFLPIICSFGYFGTTHNIEYINMITPKNAQKFYVEKNAIREKLDLQIKDVSGTELHKPDSTLHELLLTKLDKKKMRIEDFPIMRGQQVFEESREINPIEIKVEDNRIRNLFDKSKNLKVNFKLIGLLLASSIQNDTDKIFLQMTGLKSAKYALLNDEYKQIIGIVNLSQIENWSNLKQSSRWVDVTFQEQIENKNTLHPTFSFISTNKEDVLTFSLKLVDTDNNIIKFTEGDKKFPILEFMIEFIK